MRCFAVSLCVLCVVGPLQGQEAPAKSRIVSVGLFKNGLAVVKREVQVAGPGAFRLEAVPEVVHGTFWVESNVPVEAAVKLRDVETPAGEQPDGPLHEYFAGKKVTLHFSNKKLEPIQGTVPALEPRRPRAHTDPFGRMAGERFLIVRTDRGHMYVNPSEIAAIETDEGAKTTRRKPALVLEVAKADKKPAVFVSYLSHGLAWAPSYRVDIGDAKTLALEMATVMRNEMEDLADAEVSLISGFPSVEFARVSSPLEANTTWQRFFQELSSRDREGEQAILSQKIVANTVAVSVAPRIDLGAIPAGEGVDLHFQPIGKRTLGVGEAVSFSVGKAKADYERIVEWTVGTSGGGDQSRRDPTKDELWDVLNFKNPFKFPLTTAPALIVENGRFNGQRTCYWTNVGEEANVRITKSLSLRTASTEEEDKTRPPEGVALGGHNYTRIHIRGELRVNNHRDQPVKLHILYSVRGQVAEVDNEPRITPRQGSLTDVNPIRDVRWVVTLAPGQEQKIGYRYNTLVSR